MCIVKSYKLWTLKGLPPLPEVTSPSLEHPRIWISLRFHPGATAKCPCFYHRYCKQVFLKACDKGKCNRTGAKVKARTHGCRGRTHRVTANWAACAGPAGPAGPVGRASQRL